jgi:periplasmic divalent cation tolerance protein
MSDDVVLVLINAPEEQAEEIARALVEEKLAACVNVVPRVTSIYRWEGKIERAVESTLLVKTRRALVEVLTAAVKARHPYTVPEVVAVPIDGTLGNAAYLAWVLAETAR